MPKNIYEMDTWTALLQRWIDSCPEFRVNGREQNLKGRAKFPSGLKRRLHKRRTVAQTQATTALAKVIWRMAAFAYASLASK
jgi:hypothetical protein